LEVSSKKYNELSRIGYR